MRKSQRLPKLRLEVEQKPEKTGMVPEAGIEPNAFNPLEVRSLLAGGPFHEVHLHTAVLTARFASPEQFVWLEMIPSHLENPVAGMDERALSVLISEVNTALQPYVSSDGLAFPMQAHLVTAASLTIQ